MATANPSYKCCTAFTKYDSYKLDGDNLFFYRDGTLLRTFDLKGSSIRLQGDRIVLIDKNGDQVVLAAANTLTDLRTSEVGLSFEDFITYQSGVSIAPAGGVFDITPSDVSDLSQVTRSVYIGTGGDMKVDTIYGNTATFVNLQDGQVLPVRAVKVYATGTSASDLLGLF